MRHRAAKDSQSATTSALCLSEFEDGARRRTTPLGPSMCPLLAQTLSCCVFICRLREGRVVENEPFHEPAIAAAFDRRVRAASAAAPCGATD
jgi:hypothetical protein